MLIVSGSVHVDPGAREEYLAACRSVVEQARAASGCLDFALSADPLDAGRINIYERWDSDAHLHEFRGSGPEPGRLPEIRDARVAKYRISSAEAP